MKQTIPDLAYFRAMGYGFTVAMNLSTQDIQNKVLLSKLVVAYSKGLSPEALELEINESDLVADASLAIENLNELTARGFSLRYRRLWYRLFVVSLFKELAR